MQSPQLFSKRGKSDSRTIDGLTARARRRILEELRQTLPPGSRESAAIVLRRVGARMQAEYGKLASSGAWEETDPTIDHFLHCSNEQAIDFIEAIFQAMSDTAAAHHLVGAFNRVLTEERIAYELTPMAETVVKGGGELLGHTVDRVDVTYPVIRRCSDAPQEEATKECLDLLRDPAFKVANEQFLKAHQHYRAGQWNEAIAYCGSAFESAMKAALKKKNVTVKDNATAQPLIGACVEAGVFPQTYENSLIGIANVRNALSDTTHGRTPEKQIVAQQRHAKHLLYATAANIVFISEGA
jgi:hypothetical protein